MAKTFPLQRPNPEYTQTEEQGFRFQVGTNLSELSQDIEQIQLKKGKLSSLSIKRYQFLLMGASNG